MSSTTKRMWRMPGALAGAGQSSPSYEASGTWPARPCRCHPGSAGSRYPPVRPQARLCGHRVALDGCLALRFEPECGEERGRRREVVDDIPMCSRRWTVMNGLRPAPAACTRRLADTSASRSPGVVGRAARGPSPDERSRSTLLVIGTLIQLPDGPAAGSPSGNDRSRNGRCDDSWPLRRSTH
jgi:hypothetical protein